MFKQKNSIIRDRVLAHVYSKIENAQKRCDQAHEELDAKLWTDTQHLQQQHFQAKLDVVDQLVAEIVGKIV